MKSLRSSNSARDAGFTLVETLVVVAVIGILAAICVPAYLGVQGNAKDSSVKSDLVNAKTAVIAYATSRSGVVPSAVTAAGVTDDSPAVDLTRMGWSRGTNTRTLIYSTQTAGSSLTWCVLGESSTGRKWSISSNSPLAGGSSASGCPSSY